MDMLVQIHRNITALKTNSKYLAVFTVENGWSSTTLYDLQVIEKTANRSIYRRIDFYFMVRLV
jgi:hypothetical protein